VSGRRPAPTGSISILVRAYWGDFDDLDEVVVIGPYATTADRDRDIQRLAALDDVAGSAEFLPSSLDPAGADHHATPQQVAQATDLGGLIDALYGLTGS